MSIFIETKETRPVNGYMLETTAQAKRMYPDMAGYIFNTKEEMERFKADHSERWQMNRAWDGDEPTWGAVNVLDVGDLPEWDDHNVPEMRKIYASHADHHLKIWLAQFNDAIDAVKHVRAYGSLGETATDVVTNAFIKRLTAQRDALIEVIEARTAEKITIIDPSMS